MTCVDNCQAISFSPSILCAERPDGQKRDSRCPSISFFKYLEQSTCFDYAVSGWMCFAGLSILDGSTLHCCTARVPGKQTQWKDAQPTPEDSNSALVCVCTGTCQPATLICLNRMNGTEVTRQCKPCPGRHVDNEAAALLLASEFVQIKDTGSQQIPLPPLWSHTESLLQLEDTCVQGKTRDATQQWQRRMNWCSCKNALNSCRVVKKQLWSVTAAATQFCSH